MDIIGRKMPDTADEITAEENLRYKREIMAQQFQKLHSTIKQASPKTKLCINVPFWVPHEEIWENHILLEKSDILFAESSTNVVDWLLDIKKPHQKVITTVVGRLDEGECDTNSWQKWYAKGCDFFGYTWSTPPDFRPIPRYKDDMEVIRKAFKEIRNKEMK